jgi:hypothetical protein
MNAMGSRQERSGDCDQPGVLRKSLLLVSRYLGRITWKSLGNRQYWTRHGIAGQCGGWMDLYHAAYDLSSSRQNRGYLCY